MIQLSCATICTEGFTFQGHGRTFEMLPAAGYRFVEFNLWHAPALTPAYVGELADRCRAAGLRASSVHAPSWGIQREGDFAKEVSHKLWMLQVARMLGCDMLSATGLNRGDGGGLDPVIAELRELLPAAEDMGIRISLENHQNNVIESIEDYEAVFEALPSESLGCCLDTGHFDASGVSMDELIDRIGPRVSHIHVKENRGFGVKHFTRFGEGTTDNAHVIQRMSELGYDGFVVVEISPQPDRPNSLEDLRKPVDMFGPLMRE